MNTNILICGAGIIGLTLAKELIAKGHDQLIILDQASELGTYASGRNSGILHAGVYYSPGTKKAAYCLEGNHLMAAYCKEKGLPCDFLGKLIVCKSKSDLENLETIFARAKQNGSTVEKITAAELPKYDPIAETVDTAIWSPGTAVVDPKAILQSLRQDLEATGKVSILMNTTVLSRSADMSVKTNKGDISYNYFINAAGASSVAIAKQFGLGLHFDLLPFKGIYKKVTGPIASQIKRQIYPVPDLRNPFLGVHITKSIHGDTYLGPTAIPLFPLNRGLSILSRNATMFLKNPGFRSVALSEPFKYIPYCFNKESKRLVPKLRSKDIHPSSKSGVRPQLINTKTNELVMDFIFEKTETSLHILNTISPGFTCSMKLAQILSDEI